MACEVAIVSVKMSVGVMSWAEVIVGEMVKEVSRNSPVVKGCWRMRGMYLIFGLSKR